MASYCSSKFAREAFSDCLRCKMSIWGLHVSIIEPGSMQTPMTDGLLNTVNDLWNSLSTDVKERSSEDFYKYSVEHAVMNTVPCRRYRPGLQSQLFFPLSLAPTWLVDRILAMAIVTTNPPAGVHN
jgi:NAD(P)-dependent dehydrogenase (short-subunit alcohol dehydrogenase family)